MAGTETFTEQRFRQLRESVTNFDATTSPGSAPEVRRFMIRSMRPEHPWYHMYRGNPDEYDIETDLENGIEAVDCEDNPLQLHHLKHIRRFFFQRYAFRRARRINRRILAHQPGWRVRLWLWKDVILLRAALALLLGYALIFGSGDTALALAKLAGKAPWLPAIGALLLGFLVFLNARNQAGRIKGLVLRSIWVAGGTVVWAVIYCCIAKFVFHTICWSWSWSAAAGVSSAAVPLSVLAQFFFGSDRSLTDPL